MFKQPLIPGFRHIAGNRSQPAFTRTAAGNIEDNRPHITYHEKSDLPSINDWAESAKQQRIADFKAQGRVVDEETGLPKRDPNRIVSKKIRSTYAAPAPDAPEVPEVPAAVPGQEIVPRLPEFTRR